MFRTIGETKTALIIVGAWCANAVLMSSQTYVSAVREGRTPELWNVILPAISYSGFWILLTPIVIILMGSRLSYFDFTAYQAIIYDKAALVLFMLQDLVGPEAFATGLKSYFESHKYTAARTAQFFAAMEAASGRDLGEFVLGWFTSWELPEVWTTWTETAVPEGVRIDVRVTQVKGRFVFPLWVEWTRGRERGRTLVVVDEAMEAASFTLPAKPDRIRINPDKAVPWKFS